MKIIKLFSLHQARKYTIFFLNKKLDFSLDWGLGRCGRIRGRIKGLKGMPTPQENPQCKLIRIPRSSQRLSHQLKNIHSERPLHIHSRGLPSLTSLADDEPNPLETWCSREGGCPGAGHPLRGKVEGGWVKELWEWGQKRGSTFRI